MDHVELLFGPEYREHHFFKVPGQAFVICAVTLQNGFILLGQAARVHQSSITTAALYREAAEDAFRKSGSYAAFRECDRLHEGIYQ